MHNDINLVNSEVKLLYDIRELLIEINNHLTEKPIKQINLDNLKRGELMAKVKELPKKPNKWTTLSNEDLKALLKEGEQK